LEEELEETFQALAIDAIDVNPEMPDKSMQLGIDHFYTSFGQVEQQEAVSMAANLANRAFSHTVMTADETTPFPMTDQDPFSYNTTSRYTADNFFGIMIDTGASQRSTAGYGQFVAF
jgi:hypothetical protein